MTDRIADLDDLDDDEGEVIDVGEVGPASTTEQHAVGAEPTAAATESGSSWARRRERRRSRVSKWDRPPDPHDWRFFVGTLGKVLIATGILMFGFVAYQLWGTGIETARAQNRLEDAFEAAVADTADDTTDDPVPTTTTDTADDDDPPDAADDDPLPALPDPRPSEIVPGGVDLSDVAVDQEIPPIERGDAIARLQIPKIDQDLYVVAGVSLDDLKNGPGHYPETPLPGQLGNASIAGHRTTYGAPFFDVDQLVAGDQLIVTTITGDRYVYEVTGTQIVTAADYWVVTTRDPTVAELTLTSCHPKYTARDRIVVHSVLVPELSSNVGVAEFYEIDEPAASALPGDDPTLATESTPPPTEPATSTSTAPESTVAAEGELVADVDQDAATDLVGATDEAAPTTEPAVDEVPAEPTDEGIPTAPEPGTVEEPEQIDAFSEGWFDDDEAWPQIALWGLALTLISLLAYQVSKRTRHDSIGFLVGIAPFLICLYFFFQNINRLLPPGL